MECRPVQIGLPGSNYSLVEHGLSRVGGLTCWPAAKRGRQLSDSGLGFHVRGLRSFVRLRRRAAGLLPRKRQDATESVVGVQENELTDERTKAMRIGVSLPVRELKDDLGAIRDFAALAEELEFTHLRIPEQIARKESGHLHEPLTLLAYLAGLTRTIELVPSVLVLPARQTALVAKQAAEIDVLSGGRLRLGVGVGTSRREFQALGQSFESRGRRCTEQLQLLKRFWTEEAVDFDGEFHQVRGVGIDPLPIQRPIPIWIGGASVPSEPVLRRIGEHADGWFALCTPEQYPALRARIDAHAKAAGRSPEQIGAESGLGIHGRSEAEWLAILQARESAGVSHLCMRTLGGELDAKGHLDALTRVHRILGELGYLVAGRENRL